MTNAQTTSIAQGSNWLETTAFQPVRLLPASQSATQIATPKNGSPRQHRARRFVVATLTAAAITVGGVAAIHVAHASAASTLTASASVKVDPSSNPNSVANKTITALALGASSTSATTSTASLPAMGAQN